MRKRVGQCYVELGVSFSEGLERLQRARRHIRKLRTIARRSPSLDVIAEDIEEADRHMEAIAGAQGLGDDLDLPEEIQ